jgi:membrane protein YdbS with pleckstrin-like domain
MDLVPLAPAARWLFHLQALVRLFMFWTPICGGLGAAFALFWSGWAGLAVGGGLWVLLFATSLWYPSFAFDRWGWALGEDELLIQRGVLFRSLTAIPTHRIQHVDTRQGPIEQWLGLARVQIYTASALGADGVIPGIEVAAANALRERLVKVAGDDGV